MGATQVVQSVQVGLPGHRERLGAGGERWRRELRIRGSDEIVVLDLSLIANRNQTRRSRREQIHVPRQFCKCRADVGLTTWLDGGLSGIISFLPVLEP